VSSENQQDKYGMCFEIAGSVLNSDSSILSSSRVVVLISAAVANVGGPKESVASTQFEHDGHTNNNNLHS